MPIKDLAHRFQDSYRIRLGDLAAPNRPQALTDRIRITAEGPEVPAAFAAVYGTVDDLGVQPWEDEKSADRFQVYLPVTSLPIWIMPGQVLTQWWEVYKGKVCDRRCDGETEQLTGSACLCSPDIDARIADKSQCSPMTRFSVMCPEVDAVLGSGSLVTHSRIAAETFPAAMWLAGPWLRKNIPVDAVLRTHTHRGRTTFTFPTIQVFGPAQGFEAIEAGDRPEQLGRVDRELSSGTPALGTGAAPGDEMADDFDRVALANRIAKLDDDAEHKAIAKQRWAAVPLPRPDSGMTKEQVEQANTLLHRVEEEAKATYADRRKRAETAMKTVGVTSAEGRADLVRMTTADADIKRLTPAQFDAVMAACEALAESDAVAS